jgi:hypothetical protein
MGKFEFEEKSVNVLSGAFSYGAKRTAARLMLGRVGAVVLSASILGLGTAVALPQLAAAAAPPQVDRNIIQGSVLYQVGNGPCPKVSAQQGITSQGYTSNGYFSCPSNGSNNPWCADFAGWAWNRGGVYVGGLTNGVWSFDSYGGNNRSRQTSPSYTPLVGDAVVFSDPKYGTLVHVAIVDWVSGGWVTAISGNLNNSVIASTFPMAVGSSTYTGGWTGMTDVYGNYMQVAEYIQPVV